MRKTRIKLINNNFKIIRKIVFKKYKNFNERKLNQNLTIKKIINR